MTPMLVSQPGPEVSRIEARPVFKRPEQTFRRLQLLHSSVFTSELVLGMPCAALQPTSKPGRPLKHAYCDTARAKWFLPSGGPS